MGKKLNSYLIPLALSACMFGCKREVVLPRANPIPTLATAVVHVSNASDGRINEATYLVQVKGSEATVTTGPSKPTAGYHENVIRNCRTFPGLPSPDRSTVVTCIGDREWQRESVVFKGQEEAALELPEHETVNMLAWDSGSKFVAVLSSSYSFGGLGAIIGHPVEYDTFVLRIVSRDGKVYGPFKVADGWTDAAAEIVEFNVAGSR